MTPAELNKSLTLLLNDLLADTDFRKKRISNLYRKTKECEQFLSFVFTRDRGLPGNLYSLDITLSFSFRDVDKLTSMFLGQEYEAKWGTGAKIFYTLLPDKPLFKFKYCSDEPLSSFAEMVSADFHSYALPFYEKYNSLDKLETYFDQYPKRDSNETGFSVVLSGGRGCCIAAVLCLQKRWDKLQMFLEDTDLLLPEQKERIIEYISNRSIEICRKKRNGMTREEMRMKRELEKAVEKDFLKPACKRHGYKIIRGIPYCVHDGWLYEIYVSNSHDWICMVITVKPIVIDEVFWEVFEMKEEAEKQPFSFHVIAAFVPHSFWLEEWRIPITTVEQAEFILEQAFTDADEKIKGYCEQLKTIQDFKELVQTHEPVNQLNCILCDIVLGDYESALIKTEEELSSKHHGGFASIKGGDIYEYVQRYCKKRL